MDSSYPVFFSSGDSQGLHPLADCGAIKLARGTVSGFRPCSGNRA